MEPNYSKIKNSNVAKLLRELPYMELFPNKLKQKYIDKIAELPEEGQKELEALLQKQVETLPKLPPEDRALIFEEETMLLETMLKKFNVEIREEDEKINEKQEEITEQKLLDDLNNA